MRFGREAFTEVIELRGSVCCFCCILEKLLFKKRCFSEESSLSDVGSEEVPDSGAGGGDIDVDVDVARLAESFWLVTDSGPAQGDFESTWAMVNV